MVTVESTSTNLHDSCNNNNSFLEEEGAQQQQQHQLLQLTTITAHQQAALPTPLTSIGIESSRCFLFDILPVIVKFQVIIATQKYIVDLCKK